MRQYRPGLAVVLRGCRRRIITLADRRCDAETERRLDSCRLALAKRYRSARTSRAGSEKQFTTLYALTVELRDVIVGDANTHNARCVDDKQYNSVPQNPQGDRN